jgi:iron complex transport system substrate-binding protein
MFPEVRSRSLLTRRGIAALALVLWAALGSPPRSVAQAGVTKPLPSEGSLLEVTDEAGRRVKIPQPVRRIVSLAPSVTETLYALGVQDRLVGVTDYCDYPPEALTKPKVGGAINPNLEQVVALKPDLVVVTKTFNRLETVEALERLSLAVYAADAHSVEDVLASILRLADVIGAHERGELLTSGLRARLEQIKRALAGRAPRRVLFVVWQEPLISVGRGTFLADALRCAGAKSVVNTTQPWPHMSLEEVVRLDPEYLLFATAWPDEAERAFDALRERPGWRKLQAVRERHFAVVSEGINRPSPRLLDAIEQLARQLHPEAFAKKQETRNPKSGTRTSQELAADEQRELCPCAR